MSEFVLDCSATLPWIFGSEATPATERLLDKVASGAKAWVPSLWHLEVGNVLLGAQRKGRINEAGIEKFLGTLAMYNIEVDHDTAGLAWSNTFSLGERFGLTLYDAAYLELALRKGLPLASLDQTLIGAVQKAGGTLEL